MEKGKIKEWLDAIVDLDLKRRQLASPVGDIQLCSSREDTQLHTGIEKIAEAMGLELQHCVEEDREYPHRYKTVYRGVEFVQVSDKPVA